MEFLFQTVEIWNFHWLLSDNQLLVRCLTVNSWVQAAQNKSRPQNNLCSTGGISFSWNNPHTHLCYSTHKCIFLANMVPFRRHKHIFPCKKCYNKGIINQIVIVRWKTIILNMVPFKTIWKSIKRKAWEFDDRQNNLHRMKCKTMPDHMFDQDSDQNFIKSLSSRAMVQWRRLLPTIHSAQRILVHPQRYPVPPGQRHGWDCHEAHALQPPAA